MSKKTKNERESHELPEGHPFSGSKPPKGSPIGLFRAFGGSLPMKRDAFKEIRHFFILIIIKEAHPKGITGYELQEKFNLPRGNVLRILDEFIDKNRVKVKDAIETGRLQKFFTLSGEGKNYLKELTKKWATRFVLLSSIIPMDDDKFSPSMIGPPSRMLEKMGEFKSKEEAIDFVKGLMFQFNKFLEMTENRLEYMKKIKGTFTTVIDKIEKMEPFDPKKLKKIMEEFKPPF